MVTPSTIASGADTFAFRIANWLLLGRSEPSSKFMAGVALNGRGYRSQWNDPTPHDAAEFGRCAQLLQAVPEVRETFPVLRETNAVWRAYVDRWDELTSLWRVGDFNATTARLRELRAAAKAGNGLDGDSVSAPRADHSSLPQPSAQNHQRSETSQPSELTPALL